MSFPEKLKEICKRCGEACKKAWQAVCSFFKGLWEKLAAKFKKNKDGTEEKSHYLSGKEVRAIAKENNRIMRRLEQRKKRKAPESEFVTEMKDPQNILEIEDLHSYFFTDQGVVKKGACANACLFNDAFELTDVFARGRGMMRSGEIVVKGTFEL